MKKQFMMAFAAIITAIGWMPQGLMGQAVGEVAGTLHERALQSGGRLVESFTPDRPVVCSNLKELVKRSPIVIIGKALRNRSRLSEDGKSVSSEFAVYVQEVVKGDLRAGSVITVNLPGGIHAFRDGSSVLYHAWSYRLTSNGSTYLFCLRENGTDRLGRGPLFVLSMGVQGQFLIDHASGKVAPSFTLPRDPVVKRYRDMAIPSFLIELHQAAGVGTRAR